MTSTASTNSLRSRRLNLPKETLLPNQEPHEFHFDNPRPTDTDDLPEFESMSKRLRRTKRSLGNGRFSHSGKPIIRTLSATGALVVVNRHPNNLDKALKKERRLRQAGVRRRSKVETTAIRNDHEVNGRFGPEYASNPGNDAFDFHGYSHAFDSNGNPALSEYNPLIEHPQRTFGGYYPVPTKPIPEVHGDEARSCEIVWNVMATSSQQEMDQALSPKRIIAHPDGGLIIFYRNGAQAEFPADADQQTDYRTSEFCQEEEEESDTESYATPVLTLDGTEPGLRILDSLKELNKRAAWRENRHQDPIIMLADECDDPNDYESLQEQALPPGLAFMHA